MSTYLSQTTGLGVAAKIAVLGNLAGGTTVPGYNDVWLSLTGATYNGVTYPETFQLAPVLEDVAGNPVLSSPVEAELGVAAPYALLGYSGITNTGATLIAGGNIAAGTGSTAITGITSANFVAPATIDQADVAAAQTALAAAILHYQNLLPTASAISAAASSIGSTAVYTGVFVGGAANGLAGRTFAVTGFVTNASNNGTFLATASTGTTLTLANASAIAETHVASATQAALVDLSTGGNGSTAATYLPGNYFSVAASSLDIPSSITLDAQGNPNAVFVFVAGSTVTLETGASVLLVNGAQAANVVFVAGSSYTSVATSVMNGNVLAAVSATLGGGTHNGRALANTGAVTIAAATAVTNLNTSGGTNELTYVAYGSHTVTGETYIPSGTNTHVATVSPTGLITAVARGGVEVEVSFPTFNNSIGDIVSPGNIMNGLPVNKIFSAINVTVFA